jgi:hypothetical protein
MPTRKKLTTAEKRTLTKYGDKAFKFFSGKKPSAEDRQEFLTVVEGLKNRRGIRFGKEAIALWAAKIDYAIVYGDKPKLQKLVTSPFGPEAVRNIKESQFWDSNGGCNCAALH